MILPESATRPSVKSSLHDEPGVHSLSQCIPNQYCSMNSAVVSADQRRSGEVRMKVT